MSLHREVLKTNLFINIKKYKPYEIEAEDVYQDF